MPHLKQEENGQCSYISEKEGFFYVASGDIFRKEAIKSVKSLKKSNPYVHVTLFTDKAIKCKEFDQVIIIDSGIQVFDKIIGFEKNVYDKAVYLDTDTYITEDISDLFKILDNFDFAACIEVARGYWYKEHEPDMPDSFPELNSGVIVFKKSLKTKKLFEKWKLYYEESKSWQLEMEVSKLKFWDQPGLRKALYFSKDIRLTALSSEYNALRMNGTYVWGKAKIVHGRGNIEEVARRINKNPDLERCFFQGLGVIADFSRISFKDVIQTVLRVNVCAILEAKKRALKALFGHK